MHFRTEGEVRPKLAGHQDVPGSICRDVLRSAVAVLERYLVVRVTSIRLLHSEEEPDLVSRRVNAILEATPMHLITSYFEHAYEMPTDDSDEDGYGIGMIGSSPPLGGEEETLRQLEALLGYQDRLARREMDDDSDDQTVIYDPEQETSSTQAPLISDREEPADVLSRVEAMAREGPPPSAAFAGQPDMLALSEVVQAATPVSLPSALQVDTEDAASILARAEQMARDTANGPAMQSAGEAAAAHAPAAWSDCRLEDAQDVLVRVQALLEESPADNLAEHPAQATTTTDATTAAHGHVRSPQTDASLSSVGIQEDVSEILARVERWLQEGQPDLSHSNDGIPPTPPSAGAQEDPARVLARVNRWTTMGLEPDGFASGSVGRKGGPADRMDAAEGAERKEEQEHELILPRQATADAETEGGGDGMCGLADAFRTMREFSGASETGERGRGIHHVSRVPLPPLEAGPSRSCTWAEVVPTCACGSSGALIGHCVAAGHTGVQVGSAQEDAAAVLARARNMAGTEETDPGQAPLRPAPAAADARPRLRKAGQWAWERTPETCCSWEKRLVMQAIWDHGI